MGLTLCLCLKDFIELSVACQSTISMVPTEKGSQSSEELEELKRRLN
jgi:hypothetical protein